MLLARLTFGYSECPSGSSSCTCLFFFVHGLVAHEVDNDRVLDLISDTRFKQASPSWIASCRFSPKIRSFVSGRNFAYAIFRGFFIKVARVYYIIKQTEKTMEVATIPFWQLCVPIVIFMLGEVVFNLCWDLIDEVVPNLEKEEFDDNTHIMFCAGNKYMWLGKSSSQYNLQ